MHPNQCNAKVPDVDHPNSRVDADGSRDVVTITFGTGRIEGECVQDDIQTYICLEFDGWMDASNMA